MKTHYVENCARGTSVMSNDISFSVQVCFDCRTSYKGNCNCAHCGKKLCDLGKRAKIPRKNDIRGWKKLSLIYRNVVREHALLNLGYSHSEAWKMIYRGHEPSLRYKDKTPKKTGDRELNKLRGRLDEKPSEEYFRESAEKRIRGWHKNAELRKEFDLKYNRKRKNKFRKQFEN